MKRILAFCLISLMVFGCAGRVGESKKRTTGISKAHGHGSQKKVRRKARRPQRLHKASRKKAVIPLSRLFLSKRKIHLPSIIHLNDQSEMVLVNAGEYLVGNLTFRGRVAGQETNPVHLQSFTAFYIDRNEIKVEQYKRFDPSYDEKLYTDHKECPSCPAMGVDWNHAKRYCLWAGKRLPREQEWEAAARGSSSGPWPWGNEFLLNRANVMGNEDGYAQVAPVGSFPLGASPHGALDMIGNVWEWVDAPIGNNSAKEKTHQRIVKGGGWSSGLDTATISYRNFVDPKLKNPAFGFRCVKSPGINTDIRLPSS